MGDCAITKVICAETTEGTAVVCIKVFDKLMERKRPGEAVESTEFNIQAQPFTICVYPNGN